MSDYARYWSADYSGVWLRAADGRRTRVYPCLDAARRALERGELYSDADYAAGRFAPTPGNPTPGRLTLAEQAANAEAERRRRYHANKRRLSAATQRPRGDDSAARASIITREESRG